MAGQLALSAWHEPAHRALLLAYVGLGDLPTARTMYARCRETLEVELGVAPSAETQALWQRLSAEKPNHNLPAMLPPFFGRIDEIDYLEQALTDRRYRLLTLMGIGDRKNALRAGV